MFEVSPDCMQARTTSGLVKGSSAIRTQLQASMKFLKQRFQLPRLDQVPWMPNHSLSWVAVKELKLSCYKKETRSLSGCP